MHNWFQDLNLMCSSNVGLLGSLYFLGIAVSTFVIPRLSDIFGRKLSYHASMVGHLIAYGVILLSRNLTLTIVMMFFFGFFSLGRASIGYIYMQELLPTRQQTAAGTTVQVLAGAIPIFCCLYFYLI